MEINTVHNFLNWFLKETLFTHVFVPYLRNLLLSWKNPAILEHMAGISSWYCGIWNFKPLLKQHASILVFNEKS